MFSHPIPAIFSGTADAFQGMQFLNENGWCIVNLQSSLTHKMLSTFLRLTVILILLFFSSCINDVYFAEMADPLSTTINEPVINTAAAKYESALAVRASACIPCGCSASEF